MDRSLKDAIRRSRRLLQNPYAHLNGEGGYDAMLPGIPTAVHGEEVLRKPVIIPPSNLLNGRVKGKRFSKKELEDIARKLQVEMWLRRQEIWLGQGEIKPLDILDPVLALKAIGYSVEVCESLGQYRGQSENFEVAGILDNDSSRVQISRRFSRETCNFTTAHELGHAILHEASGLHRDRALDGTFARQTRPATEIEADNFAAYFLLPAKQVRKVFAQNFLTHNFVLNETTAFALSAETLPALQGKCRTIRDLTRLLASAEHYNGVRFDSIAKQFGVSNEAMAIRLEELGLIDSPH
jgi:Zn-dependent peptidase ImmA (M78 family)